MRRRAFLGLLAAAGLPVRAASPGSVDYAKAMPGYRMRFPRDHGAHPSFRNEWWYVTGIVRTTAEERLGFQITFFRNRPAFDTPNPSRFAPRQLLFAHAALSDPAFGRLRHDQRAARAALGLAGAAQGSTQVWIDDWTLALEGDTYAAIIQAREFSLDLRFQAGAPPLLQGESGFSRKGRRPQEASHYYSRPQMSVRGSIARANERGRPTPVQGRAWLDHEWSSTLLAPEASGWDWTGINLADGGALMAFRIRSRTLGAYYAGGTLRRADGSVQRFGPSEVRFTPLRTWRSPRSGAEYPIAMEISLERESWQLEPLLEDQEMDARASTNTIYWEGAMRALRAGAEAGAGYLELTGYWKPLQL